MTPIKPLSVKFDPAVREQIKRISFLLDWPEGQFVNASVAVVLEMIDNPAIGHVPKMIHLARHALDYPLRQRTPGQHGGQPHSSISLMNSIIKIPQELLSRALTDLERDHPFAFERVGFFSFRQSSDRQVPLLICYDYHPVPDEQYLRDEFCGACIGPEAIRTAMERSLATGAGQLHVHTHGRDRSCLPSGTNSASGPGINRSLANAVPAMPHGWIVLSETEVAGQVLFPVGTTAPVTDLAVVGSQVKTPRRRSAAARPSAQFWRKPQPKKDRYSRQSFLGPDSQGFIEDARIGVAGLGGGGSHIIQQLAHIGFKNYVPCDTDHVEDTNLNRLVGGTVRDHREKRLKIDVATRIIRKLQPDAIVDSKPGTWEDKIAALRTCDIIVGCLDGYLARRDLEAFCRGRLIPLVDIGMDVHRRAEGGHEIYGQVILSMPGCSCFRCMGFITDEKLAEEGRAYGEAGARPQVVWPNGALASAAVGIIMDLLTNWAGRATAPIYLEYRGSAHSITRSGVSDALVSMGCPHFALSQTGDARFKMI
jgi:ThiF family